MSYSALTKSPFLFPWRTLSACTISYDQRFRTWCILNCTRQNIDDLMRLEKVISNPYRHKLQVLSGEWSSLAEIKGQDSCANLILDKPPGYQIPGQAVAVKVAVHLSWPWRRLRDQVPSSRRTYPIVPCKLVIQLCLTPLRREALMLDGPCSDTYHMVDEDDDD